MTEATMNSYDARASIRPALSCVETEPAPDADVCGFLGCRETAQLIRGVIDGFGQRVLCAEHMADLVRREVLDDE